MRKNPVELTMHFAIEQEEARKLGMKCKQTPAMLELAKMPKRWGV
jgi:hypothetical protein